MVTLVAPRDSLRCIPLAMRAVNSPAGARLGGRAPSGIFPAQVTAGTVYFATMPLDGSTEVSVFLNLDDRTALLRTAGQFYRGSDLGPIQLVVHGPSPRGAHRSLPSPLADRALVLSAEVEDWYTSSDGERTPVGRHKVGGRPAIFRYWELEAVAEELLATGFLQVLQFDIPGPEDDIGVGSWPFGDGMFHLLGREPFGRADWACFWEN